MEQFTLMLGTVKRIYSEENEAMKARGNTAEGLEGVVY